DESKKLADREKQQQEFFQKALENASKAAQRFAQLLAEGQKKQNADQLAGAELDILKAPKYSTNRLQLQQNLLKLQMQQELQNKDLTENQKLLIERQYQDKAKQASTDHWNKVAG